jgi:hypothetical protein
MARSGAGRATTARTTASRGDFAPHDCGSKARGCSPPATWLNPASKPDPRQPARQAEYIQERLRFADGHVRELRQEPFDDIRRIGRCRSSAREDEGCHTSISQGTQFQRTPPDALVPRKHDPTLLATAGEPDRIRGSEREGLACMPDRRSARAEALAEQPRVNALVEVEDCLLKPRDGGRARSGSLPRSLATTCHSPLPDR